MAVPGSAAALLLSSVGEEKYTIERSLRLDANSTSYLSRTPSSVGNRKRFTWSGWVKRVNIPDPTEAIIFGAGTNGFNLCSLSFETDDQLRAMSYNGSYVYQKITTAVFRDPSAWYHIVQSVETENEVAEDRIKLYVNGVRITDFATNTNPAKGVDVAHINSTSPHYINKYINLASYGSVLLADIHFIDGEAHGPDAFGLVDPNTGVWVPKAFEFAEQVTYTSSTITNVSDAYQWASQSFSNLGGTPVLSSGVSTWGSAAGLFTAGNSGFYGAQGVGQAYGFTWYVEFTLTTPIEVKGTGTTYFTGLRNRNSNGTVTLYNTEGGYTSGYYYSSLHSGTQNIPINSGASLTGKFINKIRFTASSGGNNDRTFRFFGIYIDGIQLVDNVAGPFDGKKLTLTDNTALSNFAVGFPVNSTANTITKVSQSSPYSITVSNGSYEGSDSTGTSGGATTVTQNRYGYGTNGARLSFSDNSSNASLGADSSGNNNTFTTHNLSAADGAAVTVGAATGAQPIRNTTGDQGGTAASGFRTDANASNLYLALPLNSNTSDVSNSINSNSTTKTTTNQSTATSSSKSRLYGASSYWNANSDGILVAQSGAELVLGTGDFTIEFWFYDDSNHNGTNSRCYLFSTNHGGSNTSGSVVGYVDGSANIKYNANGGVITSAQGANGTDNKWFHYAAVRSSGTTTLYINGVSAGSHSDTSNYASNGIAIGRTSDNNYGWAGYIQDFRVYKTAKYTADFKIPVEANPTVAAGNDSLIDTPTNYTPDSGNPGGNYATWNPLSKSNDHTLSNGNLDSSFNNATPTSTTVATIGISSGKFYWESTLNSKTTSNGTGVAGLSAVSSGMARPGQDANTWFYVEANGRIYHNNSTSSYGDTYAVGDVIGTAFDADNGNLYFYKNGVIQNSGTPAATGLTSGPYFPAIGDISVSNQFTASTNFGQRSFKHPPGSSGGPSSDFKSLCTENLPEPAIADPSKAFDISLWAATGTAFKLGGQAYASGITTALDSSYPAANAFDGSQSTHARTSGTGVVLNVDFSPGIPVTSSVEIQGEQGYSTPNCSITVSGTTTTAGGDPNTAVAGSAGTTTKTFSGVSGTLTNLKVGKVSSGRTFLSRILIDGVALINGDGKPFAFSPDLFWSKSRSTTWNNGIHDTVRGPNKLLRTDTTGAESTPAAPNEGITSFNSDGVTFGPDGAAATVNYTGTYVGWAWDVADNSNRTYTVTVVSDSGANKYRFDGHGTSAVTLDLEEGSTYVFDSSDDSVDGHPFVLGTSANSNPYSTGVTYTLDGVEKTYSQYTSGFASATTRKLTITIPASAPTLYYWCSQHSGMGGQINTNSTAGATVLSGSLNSSLYNQAQTWSSSLSVAGSWDSGVPAPLPAFAFDGNLETEARTMQSSNNVTFNISSNPLSYSDKVEIYTSSVTADVRVNGGSAAQVASYKFVTIASGGGTLNTISLNDANSKSTIRAIRVDGKILADPTVNTPKLTSKVRADNTAGVSIVEYRGTLTGAGYDDISHGLNTAPDLVISKNKDSTSPWIVQHKFLSIHRYLKFDNSAQLNSSTAGGGFLFKPTPNVFYASYLLGLNTVDDHIAYCFSNRDGYFMSGTYEGNQNNDGPFCYCGFSPKLIWLKCIDNGGVSPYDWFVFDTERSPNNVTADTLKLNLAAGEYSYNSIDILSNGFKIRRDLIGINLNLHTFVFCAWASNPFKNSLAR